jgi:diaminopimelate epimerase
MRFAKGHGTGNDFLILPDPDDRLALPPELVSQVCDRRTGLGADGVLRIVRSAAACPELSGAPEWFMDYRNADGSVAEMCGNGIRVFARYLLDHGLAAGPVIAVATRAGIKQIRVAASGEFTVDMGAVAILGAGSAVVGGQACEGLAVSIGNPHLACVVDAPVASFDLSSPPVLDQRQFPGGANVEIVRLRGGGEVEMRVYERGSGVTLSCGTGAVAAAVAAAMKTRVATGTTADGAAAGPVRSGGAAGNGQASAAGSGQASAAGSGRAGAAGNGQASAAGSWTVHVPGGRLVVTLSETTSLLTGPAVIVAEGELTEAWLASRLTRSKSLSLASDPIKVTSTGL